MEASSVAGQEIHAPSANPMRGASTDEDTDQEASEDFAERKFLILYESLQWHMYL